MDIRETISYFNRKPVQWMGGRAQVRLTSNYHTGGAVIESTETESADLVREAQKIARLFDVPVIGVDFLVNSKTGRHWVIELSPDLAISPPEGGKVVRHFLDYLFPEAKPSAVSARPIRTKRRGKRKKNNMLMQRPARNATHNVAGGRKGAKKAKKAKKAKIHVTAQVQPKKISSLGGSAYGGNHRPARSATALQAGRH